MKKKNNIWLAPYPDDPTEKDSSLGEKLMKIFVIFGVIVSIIIIIVKISLAVIEEINTYIDKSISEALSKIEMERNEMELKRTSEIESYIDKYISEALSRIEMEKKEEESEETSKIESSIESNYIRNEVVEWPDVYVTDVPNGIFYYTDYRFYGLPNTPHYRMQQRAWTDELGCRRFNDDYIVALGSGYTVDLGERYGVLLNNGTYFTIIMGDAKADCDTDSETHTYMPCYDYDGNYSANVLEFIVDTQKMDPNACNWGGVHYYPQFKGQIIKMTYLGRDDSCDWDSYV